MKDSVFSTYWYRVARLKPALRDTVAITRHIYRGQPWYVLQNTLNGRSQRFNVAAYNIIGQLDGRKSVQEIWDSAAAQAGDACPSQDEVIRLLGKLHDADLVQSDILPSTAEAFRKSEAVTSGSIGRQVSNPFALRFPLFDPDRFLQRWIHVVSPVFTRPALMLWAAAVFWGMITMLQHWNEISSAVMEQALLPENLVIIYLVYPFMKTLHELGHAFAVKRWGGEVHEAGIMLLALTPVPYVDASASAAFPEKRNRIVVAAMGMMVELLLASIALLIWLEVEPGIVRSIAMNVMIVGGVSTILFNGNPLLRYDGYYILCDLIEIPNLAQRSVRYIGYLVQRYVVGIQDAESPAMAPGERFWFLLYGPAAFIYRIAVVIGIAWFISGYFFFFGVAVAVYGLFTLLIVPAVRAVSNFFTRSAVAERQGRIIAAIGLGAVVLSGFLFFFPIPLWSTSQGIIWLPEQSIIRAGADSEILEVLVPEGSTVSRGTPLIRGDDPFLNAEIAANRALLDELYATWRSLSMFEQVKRKIVQDKIRVVKDELERLSQEQQSLIIRSPADGRFILADFRNLPGLFVKRGQVIGYVVGEHAPLIRTAVTQEHIGLVQKGVSRVEVKIPESMADTLEASILRVVPEAEVQLPSASLGTAGGGPIPVDPADPEGRRALVSFFQIDISVPHKVSAPHIGERVYVRFDYGTMPVGMQWYRSLRQLFLKRFHV